MPDKIVLVILAMLLIPGLLLSYTASGPNLITDSGNPVRVTGVNVPYLLFMGRAEIAGAFNNMSKAGIGAAKIYASYHGKSPYSFHKSLGVYNEKAFKKLDFAVAEAAKKNIKLIITLMDNNKTYGGKEIYKEWVGGYHTDIFFKDKIPFVTRE